ncbi:MAG TPA: GNAT family N-acetyltransferase [Steroidobacteraceae bacterium]|nr:GNAT family N-acetyltransferase [Steroidobacteraceae bacterium]
MTAAPSTVRKATFADRSEILALQHLSLRVLGRDWYSEHEIESYLQYTPTLEQHLIEDSTYYVARIGERLAGCGGWSLKKPAYSAVIQEAVPPSRALAKVRAMFVHPYLARRGVGRQLLGAIERAILDAGYEEASLEATVGGVLLYARCGYTPVGETYAVLPNGARFRFVCMHKRLVAATRPYVELAV